MELLKTLFPLSFAADDKQSLIQLIITFIISWVVCAVGGWLLGMIPLVKIVAGIVFGIIGLYMFITLILGILVFLGILKK